MSIDYKDVKFNYLIIDHDYPEMKKMIKVILDKHGEEALYNENLKIIETLSMRQEIIPNLVKNLVRYMTEFLSPYAKRHLCESLLTNAEIRKKLLSAADRNIMLELL